MKTVADLAEWYAKENIKMFIMIGKSRKAMIRRDQMYEKRKRNPRLKPGLDLQDPCAGMDETERDER